MTYTQLEQLVGKLIDESGTKPVGDWVRYPQADRQTAIKWAELLAARHLPTDRIPALIVQTTLTTSGTGRIEYAQVSAILLDVIDLWDSAADIHFKKLEGKDLRFKSNLNRKYSHYWHYVATSGTVTGVGATKEIQILYPTGYDPTDCDSIIFRIYPSSNITYTAAHVTPFVGEEELIAKGAASYLLDWDNPQMTLYRNEFFQELGIKNGGNDSQGSS